MSKTKFTVRVDVEVFESAKQYARQHGTTVTNLVEEYFRSLGRVSDIPKETPILIDLAGSLRPDTSLDEYRTYLEGKYLGNQ